MTLDRAFTLLFFMGNMVLMIMAISGTVGFNEKESLVLGLSIPILLALTFGLFAYIWKWVNEN